MYVRVRVRVHVHVHTIYIYIYIYIYIHIMYIYIYMVTPHELPTLVLYRRYRVKTAVPAGLDSVSLKKLPKASPDFKRTCQSTHSR